MPRFTRIAACFAAIALVGGVAASATAATPEPTQYGTAAASECRGHILNAGPKLRSKAGFRTECIGLIQLGRNWGICIDYGLQGPDGKWGNGPIRSIQDSDVRARVSWLANAYTDDAERSPRQAAALKGAIGRLLSADFRYDWAHSYVGQYRAKDPAVPGRSDEMLAASKAAGDVKATAVLTVKPKPGGVGVVEITAKGAGRAIAGAKVTWSLAGAQTVKASDQTRADGTASIRFTWDGAKAFTVNAAVTSPASDKAVFSTPNSRRKQHLVRGGYSVRTTAQVRYDALLGATVEQNCDTTCDGKPPVTLTAEAGAQATTWQALIGGKVVASLNVAAGRSGTKTFTGMDGDRIALRYRIGKGKWRAAKTTFTVVCPPWPAITVVKTCVCKGAGTVTYEITKPAGIRAYVARFTVNGQTETSDLAGTKTFTAPLTAGTTVELSFSAYDKPGGTELAAGVLDGFTQS